MVIPFGGMGFMQDRPERPVPRVIKEVHAKYWWGVLFLMIAVIVLEILAVRTFDAIFVGLLAFFVWSQVKSSCVQMTQYCMMFIGIICFIHSVIEIITLVGSLSGRRSQSTSKQNIDRHSYTFTTKIESHPFFEPSQGFTYNMQSVTLIISPLVMFIVSYMSYWSFSAFRSSLLSGNDDVEDPNYGGTYQAVRSANRFDQPTMTPSSRPEGQHGQHGQQGPPQQPAYFGGAGRRLGSGPTPTSPPVTRSGRQANDAAERSESVPQCK